MYNVTLDNCSCKPKIKVEGKVLPNEFPTFVKIAMNQFRHIVAINDETGEVMMDFYFSDEVYPSDFTAITVLRKIEDFFQ